MNRATANLLLLVTGAVWGGGFVAQSTAMHAIGPIFFTGLRFLVAALVVLPFAVWEARRAGARLAPEPAQWRRFGLLGALLFSSLATQQVGLLTTSITNAGFLTGIYVVLTPLVGIALWRLWPHPVIWPAALLSLAGIFLLSGGSVTGLAAGDWWMLLCAFLWACHVQFLGRFVADARPFQLACSQFLVCGLIGMALAPLVEPVAWSMATGALKEILFAGGISGGVAFTLQVIAQRYTTAPQAAIFMSSEALFAALLGALLLGERMNANGFIGCALIFLSMLAVEIVPMLRGTKRPA